MLALSIFLCLSLGRVAETTHWLFKHSLGNYAQSSIVFKFLLLSLSLAFSSTDINYLSHHCPLQRPSLSLSHTPTQMAPKNDGAAKKVMNKGAWTSEEDRKLSEYIEIHGAKRWKTVAAKSGYISYMFLPNISTEGEKWKKKK